MELTNYCSPKEFSLRSGLSLATIYRHLRNGSLPFVQLGGFRHRILIPCDALDQIRQATTVELPSIPEGVAESPKFAPLSGPKPQWLKWLPELPPGSTNPSDDCTQNR